MTVRGLKRQVIAERLGIQPGTVNNLCSHVYKFGTSNRDEPVRRMDERNRNLEDGK